MILHTRKLYILFLFISIIVKAQLPEGSVAPNWTLTDINGNTHTLYDYLDQGKSVVIDFSTTWCSPCWNYHETHALDSIYIKYGPSGTDEMRVFFIEGDLNTDSDQLHGIGSGTEGDWVTGTSYPIIDLTELSVVDDYMIPGWPTIYMVCPDRTIIHSDPGAQQSTEAILYSKNGNCGYGQYTNDVRIIYLKQPEENICDDFEPIIKIQNYGTDNLQSFNIIGKIDGNTVFTQSWTGDLSQYGMDLITLPVVDIASYSEGSHTFIIETQTPNGNTDEDSSNNIIQKDFNIDITDKVPLELSIHSDLFPSQISWYIKEGNTTIMTGYGYSDIDTNIFIPICLNENTCYKFIIYDTQNDGFTHYNGSVIMTSLGQQVFSFTEQEHDGSSYTVEFCTDSIANSIEIKNETAITIYPNPANNYIIIKNEFNNIVNIKLLDIAGNILVNNNVYTNRYVLNINKLEKGIYFVNIDGIVKKIVKN